MISFYQVGTHRVQLADDSADESFAWGTPLKIVGKKFTSSGTKVLVTRCDNPEEFWGAAGHYFDEKKVFYRGEEFVARVAASEDEPHTLLDDMLECVGFNNDDDPTYLKGFRAPRMLY